MKNKIFGIIAIILISVPEMLAAKADINLYDLISEALQENPELKASYYDWQSSKAVITQAGSLPDPIFGFNMMNVPTDNYVLNQEPMTGKQFSIMQMFPFPGKLKLKKDVADADASFSEEQYLELKNHIVKNVTEIYYEIFYIDKAIETTGENAALLEQFAQVAEIRYRTGKGLQQDVLRAQVEIGKNTDKMIRLRQNRKSLTAQLNSVLNCPLDNTFGKAVVSADTITIPALSRLIELADINRPLIKAWQERVKQSDYRLKLAQRGYLPDISLGIAYTQREKLNNGAGGVDYLSGSINMNIPLFFWKKQKKQVEERRLEMMSVSKHFENIRRQVIKELETKLAELQAHQQLLALYDSGIIVQASQALNSSLAAYQADKVDFLTVLNNQVTLLNYELEYFRVLSNYHKNIAELEVLIGTNLE